MSDRYATRASRARAKAAGGRKCTACGVRWIQADGLCRRCWRAAGHTDSLREIQSRQARVHDQGIPVPDTRQPEKYVVINGVEYLIVFDGTRAQ